MTKPRRAGAGVLDTSPSTVIVSPDVLAVTETVVIVASEQSAVAGEEP